MTAIGSTAAQAQSITAQYINGIPQADQFPGADMCVKIAAAIYSLPNQSGDVDATHFSGSQPCSVNPFASTTSTQYPQGYPLTTNYWGHLSVRLGHVTIQSSAAWQIQFSKITLTGISPTATQLQYTGTAQANAVLSVSPIS